MKTFLLIAIVVIAAYQIGYQRGHDSAPTAIAPAAAVPQKVESPAMNNTEIAHAAPIPIPLPQPNRVEDTATKQRVIALIQQSELRIRITDVRQIANGGALMGGMNATDLQGHNVSTSADWYLVGQDTTGWVDGASIFSLRVYSAGVYHYTTVGGGARTVRRCASTPEIAYALLAKENTLPQLTPADHSSASSGAWMRQQNRPPPTTYVEEYMPHSSMGRVGLGGN